MASLSIDPTRAGELSIVAYSFVSPVETFDMIDTEGAANFNACVDGGRLGADVNATGHQGLHQVPAACAPSVTSRNSDAYMANKGSVRSKRAKPASPGPA